MDARSIEADAKEPASRGYDDAKARELLAEAESLIVAKGKKVRSWTVAQLDEEGREEAVTAMLGPTGKLRAPTLVVGSTLLVGFHEDAYEQVFGA